MSDNRKVSVGGQALIEGILMKGPKCSAMALRMPDNTISVEEKNRTPIYKKYKILGLPVIRGVANFIDSMVFGYKCTMESAEKTSFEDLKSDNGEEMSKVDRWITDHFGEKMMTAITIIASVLGVALSLFLFMWLPAQIFTWINQAANESISNFRGLFEGVMRLAIFVGYMFAVSRMKEIKRVFMYHGAEHKSIFCYENGLELTVENVREQSRFHPRCGTSFMIVMIIISVVFSSLISILIPAVTKYTIVWVLVKTFIILPIVMGLGYEFIKYAGCHDNKLVKILSTPGLWMQRLTTVEPTDDIIEVGIVSLKAALYGVDKVQDEIIDETEETDYEAQEEIYSEDEAQESETEETDEEEIIVISAENEEEVSDDIINKSVDEMMEELFKETSFKEEI
ncbi:MAG: DUF1385 domain-containing protein [Clostridia bacterium]|nr:DUF1385 domain-containing protein [Clostridia bacterium]